jgi:hypothetical protein
MYRPLKEAACLWRNAPSGGNAAAPSSVSETLAQCSRTRGGLLSGRIPRAFCAAMTSPDRVGPAHTSRRVPAQRVALRWTATHAVIRGWPSRASTPTAPDILTRGTMDASGLSNRALLAADVPAASAFLCRLKATASCGGFGEGLCTSSLVWPGDRMAHTWRPRLSGEGAPGPLWRVSPIMLLLCSTTEKPPGGCCLTAAGEWRVPRRAAHDLTDHHLSCYRGHKRQGTTLLREQDTALPGSTWGACA